MKYQFAFASAVVMAAAGMTPAYGATTVNFDQGTNAASYASQGLVLTNFTIDSNTYGGAVILPSTPNYAALGATGGTISFVDASGRATTSNGFGLTTVGLNAGNGYFDGATLTFLGSNGTVLGTQTFSPVGPNAGRSTITYNNTYANIASITFTRIVNPAGTGLFAIDNVTFTPNAVAGAVPEIASWAMMIAGMGLVGGVLRRRIRASEVRFDRKIERIAAGDAA